MDNSFKVLVSPKTSLPLKHDGNLLKTEDGAEVFQIKDGIAMLLTEELNEAQKYEAETFDSLDIKNVSYFRQCLFDDVINTIRDVYKLGDISDFTATEMGGGEGHLARNIKERFPYADVFVCDLSMKTLERAPKNLKKICADMAYPVFMKKKIGLAVFWVSLHHLTAEGRLRALKSVYDALSEEGILLVFEPNDSFFLRKMLYKSRFSSDVYADVNEKALDFADISSAAKSLGLIEVGTYFMNPPYNPKFVRKLKKWLLYLIVVEFLYRIDKWIIRLFLGDIFSDKHSRFKRFLTLYGCAIYRKQKIN